MSNKIIIVYISDDYYKAYVSIKKLEFQEITSDDIFEELKSKHVEYGIDIEVVKAISNLDDNIIEELVAEGQPHIHGVNSEIIHHYKETQNAHPKLLDDGSVDFKSLSLLQKVYAGDILASKVPSTEGINGITVTGKVIHAKNGKDVNFSFGENVELSEDGLNLIASCDGIYKMENNKVSVQNYLEFPDGVGINTGNVFFEGDVTVNGNVSDDYIIECDGDLNINGLVEGARIKVKGDLTITKGISGHEISVVTCGGNFVTGFIDNATVTVHGNLEAGEILNSTIFCDGEVTVKGKKGHIIGGEITARYAINATTIGSRLGVITLINLGVDIDSIKEIKQLRVDIEKDKKIAKQLSTIEHTLRSKEYKNIITEGEKNNLEKCHQNLVQIKYMIKDKSDRLEELQDLLIKAKAGQIKTETIYADTLIKIGKSSYFIDEAVLHSIIKKSGDEIIAIGF